MLDLAGYDLVDTLGGNEEYIAYRLRRSEDGATFIVKTTRDVYPAPELIAGFQQEYEFMLGWEGAGIIRPWQFIMAADRPVLFATDNGGDTMAQLLLQRSEGESLLRMLAIASSLVGSVLALHRQGVPLDTITPHSLLIHPHDLEVRLLDVRGWLGAKEGQPLLPARKHLPSVLPYISPEHTGRTGMTPDVRSSIYSVGVLLYEWLTGRLPFQAADPLDMLHLHLAVRPEPASKAAPRLPAIVSDIIAKCMDKTPDARYSSLFGLKADLDECLARLQQAEPLGDFPLGEQDMAEQWQFPTRLYGRENEQEQMLQLFGQVANGGVEAIWITGAQGSGKTSFIKEFTRLLRDAPYCIASGSAAFQSPSIPYGAWRSILDELVRGLLIESDQRMEMWRLRILDAAEGFAALLIELVPSLELLIGQQQPVPPLPPAEAEQRFRMLLRRFISLFSWQEQTLIFMFDNMHEADEASLAFLNDLLSERQMERLLVIGAYEEAKLPGAYAFERMQKQLAQGGLPVHALKLGPLVFRDMLQLLQDAMRAEGEDIYELTAILLHKTGGNPLYVKQFLEEMTDKSWISFDHEARRWRWDIRKIAERSVPEHAATYLSDKVRFLAKEALQALGRAACMGNSFELEELAAVTGTALPELQASLGPAVHDRLLQQVSGGSSRFTFQHERIRELAYHSLPEAERHELHSRIGKWLAGRMQAGEAINVFEIANQLNLARKLLQAEERRELAYWNMQACYEAKRSTSYETALSYGRIATDILGADWDGHDTLAFNAYQARAELEFLCTNMEQAEFYFHVLLQKSRSDLDKASILALKIQLESSKDNYREVLKLGVEALELLGFRHSFQPSSAKLLGQLLRVQWKLRKHTPASLSASPPMTDERQRKAMSVLMYATNACFFVERKGWLTTVLTMMELTLAGGLAPESSLAFIGYAVYESFRSRQSRAAYDWGKAGCTLSESDPVIYVKALTSFSFCYDSWRLYEPEFLELLSKKAGKIALESGDLWHSNRSILMSCALGLQCGEPLGQIYDRLQRNASDFMRHQNELQLMEGRVLTSLIVRLTGHSEPDDPFKIEESLLLQETLPVHGDNTKIVREFVCIVQYIGGYLFGQFREAEKYLAEARVLFTSRKDHGEYTTQYMYESLVWAQLYEEANESERAAYLQGIKQNVKRLKPHAVGVPVNYLHKYLFIRAELARITGKDLEAEDLYAKTIEDARRNGFVHNAAIASECFAHYGLRRGKLALAKIYMTEAYQDYLKWGATVKASQLASKYGNLLALGAVSEWDRIDYFSVVKSAQALSEEMEMPRLLKALLRIMLRNAGADFGAILFAREEGWSVEAHGTAEEMSVGALPLADATELLPSAFIEYASRTKQEVVLHDAVNEGMFARNAHVRDKRLRSVLCLPISHQDKLVCLLYMENKLAAGVFTKEKLDVLKLLASQCAISIDNARLYSGIQSLRVSLERQVEERTRSLKQSMSETAAALAENSVYEERNRIAQEIHDVVGHTLTSTVLQIEAGKRLLHKDKDGAVARLEGAQELVRHGLNEIRRSVHMLKEGQAFNLGLQLRQLIQETEHHTGVVIRSSWGELPDLTMAHKKLIYHALQEGLTNGIRHGGASSFRFLLAQENRRLIFQLEDNGRGAKELVSGFGLSAMRERAEQLGGILAITTPKYGGCSLRIEIPLAQSAEKGSEVD